MRTSIPTSLHLRRFLTVAIVVIATPQFLHGAAYRESIPITTYLASEALDSALMCLAIYRNCQVFGWSGPALKIRDRDLVDEISGLDAGIYERDEQGQRQTVLCFRGSESPADWKADFDQAIGDVPEQYHQAVELTQVGMLYAGDVGSAPRGRLLLSGHSLGGGLASFAALFWQKSARCFATSPLGAGTQQQLRLVGEEKLRAAPQLVTHFFIKGDRVPESALLFGAHFGRIVDPELEPPVNLSGVKNDDDRLALLALAGLNSHKGVQRAATAARTALDAWARHTMENYVAALAAHLPTTSAGFSPVGIWKSDGKFLQISSNATTFTLTANGRLLLRDEITVLGDTLRIADQGWWKFAGDKLTLGVGNVATLNYELVAVEPSRVVQWRRSALEPDVIGLRTSFERSGRSDAREAAATTAFMLKGAFKLLKGKVVTWQKTDENPFSEPIAR